MIRRRQTSQIILHCSATSPKMKVGVETIREWHKARGWEDIGYHFVINRDGSIDRGRDVSLQGAHVYGQNSNSIGICYIGGIDSKGKPADNITAPQKKAVESLVDALRMVYGDLPLKGHNQYANKACPSFDVAEVFPTL